MKAVFLCSILAVVVVLVYLGSFPGTFHYDDFPLMLDNPHVTDTPFHYRDFVEMYGGRPLTIWSFHLNYLFGGRSPLGFHLVSVALHGVVVILLFRLLMALGLGVPVAFSASLLFAVHPALVQSVNYVWARSILLMAAFGLLALLVGRKHFWAGLVFWELAILSRVEGMLFLVPLLLIDRRYRRAGFPILGLNLAAFLYGLQKYAPSEFAFSYPSWLDYWMQAPVSFWHYLQLYLVPTGFSIYHGLPPVASWVAAVASIGLILLVLAALRFRDSQPELALATGWVFIFLAPSLVVPNTEGVSESRMYAAGIGFCVAAAVGLTRLGRSLGARWKTAPRWATAVLPVVLVAFGYTAVSASRHSVWGDDVAIWREAVDQTPNQPLASYNLGAALSRVGATDEARASFERSRRLNPKDDMSYAGLGFCAEADGLLDEAQRFYETALIFNPANTYAREGLARLTGSSGGDPHK